MKLRVEEGKAMTEIAKPPLGVKPRQFWLMERAEDLSRAIHEQYAQGFGGRLDHERLTGWIAELRQIESELSSF